MSKRNNEIETTVDWDNVQTARRHLPQSLAEQDAEWARTDRNRQAREARRRARAEREAAR